MILPFKKNFLISTLHSRLLSDQSQLKEDMDTLKRKNSQLVREHNHLQQSCEEMKRLHDEDQKEITDLRSQQQQVTCAMLCLLFLSLLISLLVHFIIASVSRAWDSAGVFFPCHFFLCIVVISLISTGDCEEQIAFAKPLLLWCKLKLLPFLSPHCFCYSRLLN